MWSEFTKQKQRRDSCPDKCQGVVQVPSLTPVEDAAKSDGCSHERELPKAKERTT